VPCIFISGQNKLEKTTRFTKSKVRTFGEQEADIIELIMPITKHCAFISDPLKIRYELEKAYFFALEGRPGPVWLDIPLDVQNMRVVSETLMSFSEKKQNTVINEKDISFIHKKLNASKKPIILIGGGILLDEGAKKLRTFVEKYKFPVVFTSAAPDAYGSSNSNSIGSIGVMGCSRAAAFAVQNADLILNFGSRLPPAVLGEDITDFARNAEIIVVDQNVDEFSDNIKRYTKIIPARPSQVLIKLMDLKIKKKIDWLERCQHWKIFFKNHDVWENKGNALDMHNLAIILSECLPTKANFICDSGFADVILPTNISFSQGQECIHPVYQGAMGFAIPAAIGAYLGNNNATVCVVGEGTLMMNIQELQTISHQNLPIKIIVINNGGYAIIKRRQKELFRNRTIGTTSDDGLPVPDLKKLAIGFGLNYSKVTELSKINDFLQLKFATNRPEFIEIIGLEDQAYLEMAFRKNDQQRWEKRPIEDQSPFLDRDVFERKMNITKN
jgi:acetolactate synthase-1/2/3 large subunit